MANQRGGLRLASGLWFLAAVLAWGAQVARYVRGREVVWWVLAAGLFCAAMGLSAWVRSNRAGGPPAAPGE